MPEAPFETQSASPQSAAPQSSAQQPDQATASRSPFFRWLTYLVLMPLFALATTAFGTVAMLASLFDGSGRMQHSIAHAWGGVLLRIAMSPVQVIGAENLQKAPRRGLCAESPVLHGHASGPGQAALPVPHPGAARSVQASFYRLVFAAFRSDSCRQHQFAFDRCQPESRGKGIAVRDAAGHLSRRWPLAGRTTPAISIRTGIYGNPRPGAGRAHDADRHA